MIGCIQANAPFAVLAKAASDIEAAAEVGILAG